MMTTRSVDALRPGDVAILGVPWDRHSSFLRGAAAAPRRIREALASGSMNLWTESGIDLGGHDRVIDVGDVDLAREAGAAEEIERAAGAVLEKGASVLALGGDHAVTYPLVRAQSRVRQDLTILHLDAHADLYDDFDDDRLSHASPFARIMEEGLVAKLVQVGIRTLTGHQRAQASRFGVDIIQMKDWDGRTLAFDGGVYLSLDLDVLDPAFAPGVSHHEPGGFSTREVIKIIQTLRGRLAGADIVELNPYRDPVGTTAMVGAKLVKEIAARMLEER